VLTEVHGDEEAVRLVEDYTEGMRRACCLNTAYLASPGAQESPEGLPIDPVCHMAVDPERGARMIVHEGTHYHFCSLHCVRRFASDPEAFV
jgi:YHS domain-containing protein